MEMEIGCPKGLYLGKGFNLNIFMYADNLVIIKENENDLQRSLFYLIDILAVYNQTVSLSKTRFMVFLGQTILEQRLPYRTRQ